MFVKGVLVIGVQIHFNILRAKQYGCYDVFQCIFLEGNYFASVQISLKYVSCGPIDNNFFDESCKDLVLCKQQTITGSNVDQDLWCHMASLGPNELIITASSWHIPDRKVHGGNMGPMNFSIWDVLLPRYLYKAWCTTNKMNHLHH